MVEKLTSKKCSLVQHSEALENTFLDNHETYVEFMERKIRPDDDDFLTD